jgi:hypothetical protein
MNTKAMLVIIILIIIAISSIVISQPQNVKTASYNNGNLVLPYYVSNNSSYVTLMPTITNSIMPFAIINSPNANINLNVTSNLVTYEKSLNKTIWTNLIVMVDGSASLSNGATFRMNYTVPALYNRTLHLGFGDVNNVNVNLTILPQFIYDYVVNGTFNTNYNYNFLPDYLETIPNVINYVSSQYKINASYYNIPTYNITVKYSSTQTAGYLYSLNTYMHSFIMKYNNVNVTPVYYIFNFLGHNYTSSQEGTNLVNTTYIFYLNLTVPNGTYYYITTPVIEYQSFSNGLPIYQYIPMTNYSVTGYFIISGSNFNLNVTNPLPLINYKQIYFYAYLVISGLLILAVLKLSNGLIMAYSMSASLFMLIGYKLNLPFFNTSLIMTVITLISGMFVYLYIWSEK